MTKSAFYFLLLGTSYAAYCFAQELVVENLPALFDYDVTYTPMQKVPGYTAISEKQVVNLLWQDQELPVWIDINVLRSDEYTTILHLLCSDRYSSKHEDYYYHQRGQGPFGIKSPVYPPHHQEGKKFKLNR